MADNLPARQDDGASHPQLSANAHLTSLTVDEMVRIAKAFSQAQVFKDKGTPLSAEAIFVTILAGQEMGLGPSQAVMGISMIEGKPNISANLQAALLKASGVYDYSAEWFDLNPVPALYGKPAKSPHACKVTVFRVADGSFVGDTTFTILDALDADLTRPSRNGQPSNYVKYPRNMLFARALSNAVAFFAPDSTMVRTYHEGEMSGEPDAPVPEVPTLSGSAQQITQGAPGERLVPEQRTTDRGRLAGEPHVAQVSPPPDTEATREPARVPQADPQPYDAPEEVVPSAEVEVEAGGTIMGQAGREATADSIERESAAQEMARLVAEEALQGFDPESEPGPAPVEPPGQFASEQPGPQPRVEDVPNEPTVSAAQIRLIHVKCKEAGFTDERRHQVLREVTGTPHAERVPKSKMDDLLTRLNAEKELRASEDAQG